MKGNGSGKEVKGKGKKNKIWKEMGRKRKEKEKTGSKMKRRERQTRNSVENGEGKEAIENKNNGKLKKKKRPRRKKRHDKQEEYLSLRTCVSHTVSPAAVPVTLKLESVAFYRTDSILSSWEVALWAAPNNLSHRGAILTELRIQLAAASQTAPHKQILHSKQHRHRPSTRPAALHTGKHCITVIFISPACKINPLMFVTFLSFLFLSCSIFFNIHFPFFLISFFLFNSFLLFCFLFAFLSCCFLA